MRRRTIAWVLGGRDDATGQKLLDKVGIQGKIFLTDDWEGFHRLIPQDQLFTGKDLTVSIEQDNSNIRHFVARFRRRTKVVSKIALMVDLSLRLYHYLHDKGLSQVLGSGGNRYWRVEIVGRSEYLSEAGTEGAIIDRASDLKQQVGTASRPSHLL